MKAVETMPVGRGGGGGGHHPIIPTLSFSLSTPPEETEPIKFGQGNFRNFSYSYTYYNDVLILLLIILLLY